jgi:hypothetical protein
VQIQVVDAASHEPIAGAVVEVESRTLYFLNPATPDIPLYQQAVTDQHGWVAVELVDRDNFVLTATHEKCEVASLRFMPWRVRVQGTNLLIELHNCR